MSGIGEASLVLGLISSTIAIFEAAQEIYEAAGDAAGLPKKFRVAAEQIPLVHNALGLAEHNINGQNVTEKALQSAKPVLERCKENAARVKDIFDNTIPTKNAPRAERLKKAVGIKLKSNKVKEHMEEIFKSMELLAQNQVFQDAEALSDIKETIKQLNNIPDEEEQGRFVHSGTGAQYNQTGPGTQNIVSGNQYHAETQNFGRHQAPSADDIDRACLRALRCPDSLVVKNRLKENKDKLLHESIQWIFNDEQYKRWHDRDDVALLWIKGGAGKGKTMMSIGLIEELSERAKDVTVVTYFFCQNADYELNTVEAIIKGLMLRLSRQQEDVKKVLRDKWDTVNERFSEDISSWRGLWNIFLEMLDSCKSSKVCLIVDALDECLDHGMAHLLKLIVRTGLSRPSRVKWLLTSRPLDVAERELLDGSEQVMVSLELNAKHISQGVATYISSKVSKLDKRHRYGRRLRQELEEELVRKSEDTFLWVSLVCKALEDVDRDQVMMTIQNLPLGLPSYYHRILTQLCSGESDVVTGCVRLLKVMMLTYRPLNIGEVSSVTGLSEEELATNALVNRCASFVKMRGKETEFVHQSARDYLASTRGQSLLSRHDQYGHGEIAMSCLSYLSRQLKVNLLHLPRPDFTREEVKVMKGDDVEKVLINIDYAATLWVRHVEIAKQTALVQNALADDGTISTFLGAKLVEWLECLSLLGELPRAVEALQILKDIVNTKSKLSMLVLDAIRFLLRHYQTLSAWPLQIYSSAMIFSPQSSLVKRKNLNKVPTWLYNIPQVEVAWTSLLQTLAGHSSGVTAVAYSPDGRQIASGSWDKTVKLWDASTGDLQKTLAGHLDWVTAVAYSPDGRQIASGSDDKTVKLWDASTGDLQKTLAGHSSAVTAVAFSPDGRQIASGSEDKTVKLWDASTGDLQKTLAGHSGGVRAVAYSPDGRQIASGSDDNTVKLWDASTGDLQKTLAGHSGGVRAVAYSPDGRQIASGSDDKTVKLWDASTGDLQKTLAGHSGGVRAVAYSPDGRQIASGSEDKTVKLWDASTGDLQKTLAGHLDGVRAVAYSPDGRQIASGSWDKTVKLWDASTGDLQKTLAGHLDWVTAVAYSPDGRQIASGSEDKTVKLWDASTGDLQKTLAGHSSAVRAVAYSPDGRQIASGSEDNTVKLWDASTGDLQKTLAGHLDWVRAVAYSPDGRQIASGSEDKTVKLWDASTGDLQKTLAGHLDWVTAVAYSPDGRQIASGSEDKTVKLWDASTGDLQKTLAGHLDWVTAVAYSPDGRQIASGSWDNTVKLWDVARYLKSSNWRRNMFGRLHKLRAWQSIDTPEPISSIKFSRDGQYLATNLGYIHIKKIITDGNNAQVESFEGLHVSDQWIHEGAARMLRLPADFQASSYDVRGSQVTVGFRNGRVLSFNIDRARLLEHSEIWFSQSLT